MINFKQGLAALAVTLAVSAPASPSYAQGGSREISRERARTRHSPVQRVGGPIPAVPLGQHGDLSVPRLHDRTRPAGISLTRIARIGARESGKADQDGARTIKRHLAPDRI